MDEGDTLHWAGRRFITCGWNSTNCPTSSWPRRCLQIARDGSTPVELRPARHLHLLQNDWTTEVAIDSTWRGDFYTVLHAGLGDGRVVVMTLVDNPMIGWIWGGGAVATIAAIVAMWPVSRRRVDRRLTDRRLQLG